jgi:prepilin-type processing-associated H-X9-DG protein
VREGRRAVAVRPVEIGVIGVVVVVGLTWAGVRNWQRVREEARAAQCQTILQRYGQAFRAYAAEFDGLLPFEGVGLEQEGHMVWFDALGRYLSGGDAVCPSVDRTVSNYEEGYRINSQLSRSGGLPSEWYRRLDSLSQAEATVALFDAEYGGKKRSMKGNLKDVDYRHNGSANILFADWHVERLRPNELKEASNWLPPRVIWDPGDPSTGGPQSKGGHGEGW